ncbi:NAD binding domain of 6-phosphogluconate dehydrogenase-domain-containing protein [Elsinoe ampelina]|uniref:3-hydroxyisobutyrate dehydrogenase n=1 Tax=Elsinoe ampelina TaxID=302913 RepID=A0A6A6G6Y3_9PEZI|nr:NAD binding domain of 6-phosphogluconate dehydrogenase-domain-containing protein [Elsinoe ampelina]
MSEFKTVGFIGLGLMGKPMAGHLAKKLPADTRIHVFDISKDVVQDLASQYPDKVVVGANAKDVADKSDVIFTMVPEGAHVRSVYLTPETGILASDVSNKLLIDTSTIDTATNLQVKEEINKRYPSASFYDAPVSGGVNGAVAGTIAFFLGCAESDPNIPRITELLRLMGKQIIPCGGPSFGLAAKLSNNYLSGIIAIACSEALDMGMRSGLDPRVLAKVYNAGTAQNAICDGFCPCPGVVENAPSSRGYAGGFKVQLMRKDFNLALDMAKRVGSKNVLGEAGLDTYTQAMNDPNCKDLDSRVVYRYLGGNENWKQELESNGTTDSK